MSTIYGIPEGEFQPQPDFAASRNEEGGWIATQSFICRRSSIDSTALFSTFALGKAPSELDSTIEEVYDSLGLVSFSFREELGGLARVLVAYAGYAYDATTSGGEPAQLPRYYLRGELVRESILEHPEVIALAGVAGAGSDDLNLIARVVNRDAVYRWNDEENRLEFRSTDQGGSPVYVEEIPQPSTPEATLWIKKALDGLTEYYFPTYTFTKSYTSDASVPASGLNKLGKISVPAGPEPTASGDRDWMLESVDQDQVGERFEIALRWRMSERGGWDTDLYDY